MEIKKAHLQAALLAAASDDVRYYLKGVLVEPSGIIVATDGNRMHVLHGEADEKLPCPVIIPRDTLALVLKRKLSVMHLDATLKPGADPAKHPANYLWALGGLSFTPLDGTFPDWRRVVPAADGGQQDEYTIYNPDYLADVKKAIHFLGVPKKTKSGLVQGVPEPVKERPRMYSYEGVLSEFFAVVMPTRATGLDGMPSEWWARTKA